MTAFEPTVASLSQHRVPDWFDAAKLGIFVHWGLFSVPGFAPRVDHVSRVYTEHYRLAAVMTPYTEWYENAIRVPESPSAAHHREHWGDRPYADFRAEFARGLENWDPADWAQLFRRAGAGYVVLVTKHHDGYCLWPSEVPHPRRPNWHCERDLVRELAEAVRAAGLRFGVYYSGGIDWSFNTKPVRTLVEFVGSTPTGPYPDYAEAQMRELVERYAPSVLWNDISWPTGKQAMLQLMADYYEAVPEGVINDRWMHRNWILRLLSLGPVQRVVDPWVARRFAKASEHRRKGFVPPVPAHCDFRTPEYTTFDAIVKRKWEATRGMSPSFGYNRFDREEDYEAPEALLHSFIDSVSKNGNLLINVGPTGEEAAIPGFQRARLEFLGAWLERCGEAIYGTQPWVEPAGKTQGAGLPIRFTRRGDALYAVLLGRPEAGTLAFDVPGPLPAQPNVALLGVDQPLQSKLRDGHLCVELPRALPEAPAYALRLCGTPPTCPAQRSPEFKQR